MTANERYSVYISNDYDEKVLIAVIDWADYWANSGTGSIADPTLRQQTDQAVTQVLDSPSVISGRVKTVVLGDDAVKAAPELTDALIKGAVDRAFARCIGYIVA